MAAGPVGQVLQDHPAAHAPADQVHGVQAERGDDGGQVVGVVAQSPGGVHRLRVGPAESAQVNGQRPVGLRQGQHGRLPEQRGRHVPVHEQHRGPGPVWHGQHGGGQPAGGQLGRGDAGQQRFHGQVMVAGATGGRAGQPGGRQGGRSAGRQAGDQRVHLGGQ